MDWDQGLLDDMPRDEHGLRIPWKKRLLLVEDDRDLILMFRTELESLGFKLEIARTRSQAIAFIQSGVCDCLLTDLCLLELTGYEVLREWRDCAATRSRPAVAFTDVVDEDHVLYAYYAGADVVMVEPFPFEDLVKWVQAL